MSSNDKCLICDITRGEIRRQQRFNRRMNCPSISGRHKFNRRHKIVKRSKDQLQLFYENT